MNDDQYQFLSLLGRVPARLSAEHTAWVLGFEPRDIPLLVVLELLQPLGNRIPNGTLFFATAEVLELANDRTWLSKATNALDQFWHPEKPSNMTHLNFKNINTLPPQELPAARK
jgi:hypothetical protein